MGRLPGPVQGERRMGRQMLPVYAGTAPGSGTPPCCARSSPSLCSCPVQLTPARRRGAEGGSGGAPGLPVGHVVEVLRELGQVGALLLVLLFRPEQHLGNLEEEAAGWAGPAGGPGMGVSSFRDKPRRLPGKASPEPCPRAPLSCRRARRPAGSAAQLFRGCGSRAGSPAWKTDAGVNGQGQRD